MPDQLLGQLYSSPQRDLVEALGTMPGLQRARLAMFCTRRAHLHDMGLSIAATCSEADLEHEGGSMGAMLFRQSREKTVQEPNAPFRRRPTVSLATMSPSIAVVNLDQQTASQELGDISDAEGGRYVPVNDFEYVALAEQ